MAGSRCGRCDIEAWKYDQTFRLKRTIQAFSQVFPLCWIKVDIGHNEWELTVDHRMKDGSSQKFLATSKTQWVHFGLSRSEDISRTPVVSYPAPWPPLQFDAYTATDVIGWLSLIRTRMCPDPKEDIPGWDVPPNQGPMPYTMKLAWEDPRSWEPGNSPGRYTFRVPDLRRTFEVVFHRPGDVIATILEVKLDGRREGFPALGKQFNLFTKIEDMAQELLGKVVNIQITVKDSAQRAIPGAEVNVYTLHNDRIFSCLTDVSGTAEGSYMHPGHPVEMTVRVLKKNYLPFLQVMSLGSKGLDLEVILDVDTIYGNPGVHSKIIQDMTTLGMSHPGHMLMLGSRAHGKLKRALEGHGYQTDDPTIKALLEATAGTVGAITVRVSQFLEPDHISFVPAPQSPLLADSSMQDPRLRFQYEPAKPSNEPEPY